MLDVFNSDGFSVVSLTDAINNIKFVPGRIGAMGLFQETSISETYIAIEQQDGVLELVPPTPRGGPGVTLGDNRRTLRNLAIPHFEINDSVMAAAIQSVRAWGSETETETVQGKLAEKFAVHSQSLEATQEYARIGAIKGVVTYADASSLDLFSTFGVTQETEVDFDLDNATPASGALRKKCAGVVRTIAVNLGGVPYSGIGAMVGDAFFDDLIAHPEVRETYLGWVAAQELRNGYAYGAFPFGGILWENYRGAVGSTSFIDTNKAHIFPIGVPALFRTYMAPADYVETANTMGQRLYAKQYEMLNGKGVHLDTQMNALNICTRPKTLIQGKRT